MDILNSESAEVESRIDDAVDHLRFQHTLFSLILDQHQTRLPILRLLSHGLRIVSYLKAYRDRMAQAHAERIFRLVLENNSPKSSA